MGFELLGLSHIILSVDGIYEMGVKVECMEEDVAQLQTRMGESSVMVRTWNKACRSAKPRVACFSRGHAGLFR
jgi:hypothetical protein